MLYALLRFLGAAPIDSPLKARTFASMSHDVADIGRITMSYIRIPKLRDSLNKGQAP